MGYCMDQMEAKFFIPGNLKREALNAIKSLAGKETIVPGKHFSWVDTADFIGAEDVESALREWRWDATVDAGGNITNLEFGGEKLGDEALLFGAIAPYVQAGSYIQMQGEDGDIWRWVFDGATVKEVHPDITWPF